MKTDQAGNANPSSLSPDMLATAAYWHVQLNDESVSDSDRTAWEAWLAADHRHREAWERMQILGRQLASLPADIAVPTLSRARLSRRRSLKILGGFFLVGAAGTLFHQAPPAWHLARADYRTGTGERRHIELPDGGILDINTATAVDVNYTGDIRQLRMWRGEILVETAVDTAGRPLEIKTDQGVVRALGTQFTVSVEENRTRVAVLEKAVEIRLESGQIQRLDAGQQVDFSAEAIASPSQIPEGEGAWRYGKLIAIDRRLDDFIAELARHRPGKIVCSPKVAELRLSGAFRLGNTDAILDNLVASLPVRVRYFTRYWVLIDSPE
jgi:Fe2+-dicitrate sensor, membrane component